MVGHSIWWGEIKQDCATKGSGQGANQEVDRTKQKKGLLVHSESERWSVWLAGVAFIHVIQSVFPFSVQMSRQERRKASQHSWKLKVRGVENPRNLVCVWKSSSAVEVNFQYLSSAGEREVSENTVGNNSGLVEPIKSGAGACVIWVGQDEWVLNKRARLSDVNNTESDTEKR